MVNVPDGNTDVSDNFGNDINPNFLTYNFRSAGLGEDINSQSFFKMRYGIRPSFRVDNNNIIINSNGDNDFNFGVNNPTSSIQFVNAVSVEFQIFIKANNIAPNGYIPA